MKLKRARVRNFRSIIDSSTVEIEDNVTILIGKNGQGKTNFLKALCSFNGDNCHSANDFPSHLRPELEETKVAIPMVTLWLQPDPSEKVRLKGCVPDIDHLAEFEITRFHDGEYQIRAIMADKTEKAVGFLPPDISCYVERWEDTVKKLRQKLRTHAKKCPQFANGADRARQQIDQFLNAEFGNPRDAQGIIGTFSAAMRRVPNQNKAVQDDIGLTLKSIREIMTELVKAFDNEPKRVFGDCVPLFIYHGATVNRIPDYVNVPEFLNDPERVSREMYNLCKAAGLSTRKIEELAKSTSVNQKQAHEDCASRSISGGINEFWTQQTYYVHFRMDKERLSVSISDSECPTQRIPPTQRSDGFQWYLSFYSTLHSEASSARSMVCLLDNPGLELHADGQRDIKTFLEEKFPSTTQIICVTHSPALVDPHKLEQVRKVEFRGEDVGTIVSRSFLQDGGQGDFLEPIRSCIGASLISTLLAGDLTVLVEGATDKLILEGIFAILENKDAKRVVVNGSLSQIGWRLACLYERVRLPYVAIVDADDGGNELRKSLRAKGIPEDKIPRLKETFTEFGKQDFELEDILSNSFHAAAIQEAYPNVPPGGLDLEELPPKCTGKIRRIFRSLGYGNYSKVRVAEKVKKLLLEGRADEHTLRNLERLARLILQHLKQRT